MPRYTIIARFKGEEAPNAREAAKQIIRYVDENGIDEKELEVVAEESGETEVVDANQIELSELYEE
jgi:hypothetical protein